MIAEVYLNHDPVLVSLAPARTTLRPLQNYFQEFRVYPALPFYTLALFCFLNLYKWHYTTQLIYYISHYASWYYHQKLYCRVISTHTSSCTYLYKQNFLWARVSKLKHTGQIPTTVFLYCLQAKNIFYICTFIIDLMIDNISPNGAFNLMISQEQDFHSS